VLVVDCISSHLSCLSGRDNLLAEIVKSFVALLTVASADSEKSAEVAKIIV